MKVIVRKELEQDHKTVELLVEEAFKDAEYSVDLCQYLGHKNSNLLKLHSKP